MTITNPVWIDLLALAIQRDAMERAYQALRDRLQGKAQAA